MNCNGPSTSSSTGPASPRGVIAGVGMYRVGIVGLILLAVPGGRAWSEHRRSDSDALSAVFDTGVIAENVEVVLARASELAPAARFEFLRTWILPGDSHPDFRVSGGFTQTDPSPVARERFPAMHPSEHGGEILSPVFELLESARELGRLEELRNEIASVPVPDNAFQRRAQVALLLLIDLELDDRESAGQRHEELFAMVRGAEPETTADMWPETLVCDRALERREHAAIVADLVGIIFSTRSERMRPATRRVHHAHIAAMMGRVTHLQQKQPATGNDQTLSDWVSVVRKRAVSRGRGYPQARWIPYEDHRLHLPGHDEDYLYYRLPLRGDFEVQCDLRGHGTTQFLAAGTVLGVRGDLSLIDLGTFRDGSRPERIDPPFARLDTWVRYRAVFHDGRCDVSVNGRPLHSQPLGPHHDPWIGVRSWWRNTARIRDVRISGDPTIPSELVLSESPDLAGWYSYYDDPVATERARWIFETDQNGKGQIVGRPMRTLADAWWESLLQYHRPLVEGGTIEYEFRYVPGEYDVHPALDRLVFMLEPDGVRIHSLTDGRHDATGISPANMTEEPGNRRGPDRLPLIASDWNRMQVEIAEGVVRLRLNGVLIYERPLEDANRRVFGLFHYLGTEVRVRNLVMRGNWPTELPSVSEQELADPLLAELDAHRDALEDRFDHDFEQNGVPDVFFERRGQVFADQTQLRHGVQAVARSAGGWQTTKLVSRFAAEGDFDVEARFERLDVKQSNLHGLIFLQIVLDDPERREYRSMRGREGPEEKKREVINGQYSILFEDGQRRYFGQVLMEESTSGRLRLVRRGDRIFTLFAPGESDLFRVVRDEPAPEGAIPAGGIELSLSTNGAGYASCLWKEMSIRCEQLKYLGADAAPQRQLYIMRPDGSDLRTVTGPPAGFAHLGSPEFSADGQRIALDVSGGTTSDSHVFIVNTDGTALTDLGRGCMPGFSADGSKLVMSQPGQGVVEMDSAGENRQTLEPSAWGVQSSPDGRSIVWGEGGNLMLLDVASGVRRLLLTGVDAARYSSIYWNMGWSHDSRSIAFKGRNRRTRNYEVAVANVDPEAGLEVLVASETAMNADFTFSPDDRKVLFATPRPGSPGPRLCLASRDRPGEIEWLEGPPDDWKVYDCDWSHDGEWIAFSAIAPVQPVDWPLPDEEMKALQDAARPIELPTPREQGLFDPVLELFR
ncbi:translocation protein TolB [Maioricimonas rarisocia]|uniref:Translocation protein TolB n=1 Tax=Maioricimonas rarisocia TaxID=2528026 RepID=A0A517Z6H5_9PLAN|nr:DUF1583 domain-containing protein [Maioricimonas rarisocia]QDU38077.1 translocation protein TolB [Maioricimonas rarisocia]